MNSLVVLFLAAGAMAAPAPHFVAAAPVAAPGFAYTAVAPAVAQVQVPITKTVHYETKPVVTGYSTSIIKPAVPDLVTPGFAPFSVAAVAPAQFAHVPAPAPATIVAGPAPVAQPAVDAEIVEARAEAPVAIAQPQPVAIAQPQPVAIAQPQSVAIAQPQPVAVVAQPQPVAIAQPQVTFVRAAQAGDFGPLVTKEQVLAPVRTNTQITPQVVSVQPEVTVRKVIQDVPVSVPVVQQPVLTYAAGPRVIAGSPFLL